MNRSSSRILLPVSLAAALAGASTVLVVACGDSGTEPGGDPGPAAGPNPAVSPSPLLVDDRVTDLLHDCARSHHYDRDVADMLPILVEKLERGQTDPLHRAKEELAALGAEALPEVRRLFERTYSDRIAFAPMQNAIDVAIQTEAEEAREVLLLALQHPRDTVRRLALKGLVKRHARPEDYDDLRGHVDLERGPLRTEFAAALCVADPDRAALEYVDWILTDTYPETWDSLVLAIPRSESDELVVRCIEHWEDAIAIAKYAMAAVAARADDEAARAWLRTELLADGEERRARAVQALLEIDAWPELVDVVRNEPSLQLRSLAAGALAALDPTPEAREALRAALDDPAPELSRQAMSVLVGWEDADAIDRALIGLGGTVRQLDDALNSIRFSLRENETLAARAFARLKTRFEEEAHLPLDERVATMEGIGQIPGPEAAAFLDGLDVARSDDRIEGLRGHRWIAMQLANTGQAGREVLVSRMAVETDPLRRVDLIWALATERDDYVRDALLAIAEDDELDPYERLYAADRLTRIGPSHLVAPRLKRVCLRITEPTVRKAMQCLLWKWY